MATKRIVYMVIEKDVEYRQINHRLFYTEYEALEYVESHHPYIESYVDGTIRYYKDKEGTEEFLITPYYIHGEEMADV